MASETKTVAPAPIDSTRSRNLPYILMGLGFVGVLIGCFVDRKQFGYSWLQAFMFFLSLGVGAWFLVLVHHLFDASWSVPIRRINEQLSINLPWMAVLFLPIAFLAADMYPWITMLKEHREDHALHAKAPLFSIAGFYVVLIICFVLWWFFTTGLRRNSLEQDKDGAAAWTGRNRVLACLGIVTFALSVTMGVIMWM